MCRSVQVILAILMNSLWLIDVASTQQPNPELLASEARIPTRSADSTAGSEQSQTDFSAGERSVTSPSGRDENVQENEARVLEFVGKHQPELLELLKFLKGRQPIEFQQAMREVSRVMQRLEGLQKRDEPLYVIELGLWKTHSHLQLVAAQLAVVKEERQRESLESQLEELVKLEFAQDLERLAIQRERLAKQLQAMTQRLEQRQANRDETVAKTLRLWKNRIAKQGAEAQGKLPETTSSNGPNS